MKSKSICYGKNIIVVLLLFGVIGVAQASAPQDMRITDVSDTIAVISWTTDVDENCSVNYGNTTSLGIIAYDIRGSVTVDDTHYVRLTSLQPNTTYYFDLISGGETYNNGGVHYNFTTGLLLSISSPDTTLGDVFKPDGSPAQGTIVYINITTYFEGNVYGTSQTLSDLVGYTYDGVDNTGFEKIWQIDVGAIRVQNLSKYYSCSTPFTCNFSILARGSNECNATQVIVWSNAYPAPNMTLVCPAPGTYTIINISSNLSTVLADNESTCVHDNETCENQTGTKTIRIKINNTSVCDVPINFSDSNPDFSGVTADSGNTTNGTGYVVVHFPNATKAHKAGNKTLYVPAVINSSLVCVDADATNVSAIENLLANNCAGGEWVIDPPRVEVPPGSGSWYYKITSNETSEVSGSGGGEGSSPIAGSSDSIGNEKNIFNVSDVVYVTGENFTGGDDVCIYVLNDSNWTDGDPLNDVSIDGYNDAATDGAGDLPTTDVWNTSLDVGYYDVVVDVDCDGYYNASIDALDSVTVNEYGFYITPEPMAAILFITGLSVLYGLVRVRKKKN